MAEIDKELVEAVSGVLSAAYAAQSDTITRAAMDAHIAYEHTAGLVSPEGVLGGVAFGLAERMRYLALHPRIALALGRASCDMSIVSDHPSFICTPLLLQGPAERVNLDGLDTTSGRMAFRGDANLVAGYVFKTRLQPNPEESQWLQARYVVAERNSGAYRDAGKYEIHFDVSADKRVSNVRIAGKAFTRYAREAERVRDEKRAEAQGRAGEAVNPEPGQEGTHVGPLTRAAALDMWKGILDASDRPIRVDFPDELYVEPTGILSLALRELRLDRFLRRKEQANWAI
jgi:hypothetical protein